MSEQITSTVSTTNKALAEEIEVSVEVTVPSTLEEAAGDEFYGGEDKVLDTIQKEWNRRCVNAARPILRDAEQELDWQSVAQQAVDSYSPGRKGGFAPKISEQDVEQFDDVEELKAFLRGQGALRS